MRLKSRSVALYVGAVVHLGDDKKTVVAGQIGATADFNDITGGVRRRTAPRQNRERRVRGQRHAGHERHDRARNVGRPDVDRETASLARARAGVAVVEVKEAIAGHDVLGTVTDNITRHAEVAADRYVTTERNRDPQGDRVIGGIDDTGNTRLVKQQQVVRLNCHVSHSCLKTHIDLPMRHSQAGHPIYSFGMFMCVR